MTLSRNERLIIREAAKIRRRLNEYGRRRRYDYYDYYNYGGAARGERHRKYSHPDWGAADEYPHYEKTNDFLMKTVMRELRNLGLGVDYIEEEHLHYMHDLHKSHVGKELYSFLRKQGDDWVAGMLDRMGYNVD